MIDAAEIGAVLDDVADTLPTAVAVVARDTTIASKALRMALHDHGNISLAGIDCEVRTAVWVLAAEFSPRIRVGDVLTVDAVPALVINALTSCGNLVSRAEVVLCEDTVTVSDTDLACHVGMLAQDMDASLGGFLPDDMQGFFIPASILPEGVEIVLSTPVAIAGEQMHVEKISRDPRHGVLCVTCRRRGAA